MMSLKYSFLNTPEQQYFMLLTSDFPVMLNVVCCSIVIMTGECHTALWSCSLQARGMAVLLLFFFNSGISIIHTISSAFANLLGFPFSKKYE